MVSPAAKPVRVAAIDTLSAGRSQVKRKCTDGVTSCIPITGVWNGTTDWILEACNDAADTVRRGDDSPSSKVIVPGQEVGSSVDNIQIFTGTMPRKIRTHQLNFRLVQTRYVIDRLIEREAVNRRSITEYPSRPTLTRQLCKSSG